MKKTTYIAILFLIFGMFTTSCKKDTTTTVATYPTDGLVSYFNFDGNLQDVKGNTPDGTNTGSATFITGKAGSAINLNGIDQKIVFPKKTFKSGNNVSISFWFKTSESSSLKYFIMCSEFGVVTSSNNVGLAVFVPSTNSASGAYTNATWTHFVGTYNGTDIKAYINGELKETTNYPGDMADANRELTLGFFGATYWAGSIDDLFIYNKTLSQADVTQLYNFH